MTADGAFDAVMGELAAPMFIVTAHPPNGRPAGCLIGFATHCSVDPPRFLACVSPENQTYAAAVAARALAVHLVPRAAASLAALFGGETGDEVDKFSRCAWSPGPYETPILQACPNWFVGRVIERTGLGDHVGFLLEPLAAAHRPGHVAFDLRRAQREIEPGHPA